MELHFQCHNYLDWFWGDPCTWLQPYFPTTLLDVEQLLPVGATPARARKHILGSPKWLLEVEAVGPKVRSL